MLGGKVQETQVRSLVQEDPINGEKGPLMTQRTLALSGLRLQGGPMIPSKGGVFRRQGKDRHVLPVVIVTWSH